MQMKSGYDPVVEYRMRLIEASYQKDISYETESEISQIIVEYPESQREEVAKIIYEIVLNSSSEKEILEKISKVNL